MMPYLIDRRSVLRTRELVALLNVRKRRVRTHAVSADNSLYRTLTRTTVFLRCVRQAGGSGMIATDARTRRRVRKGV